MFCGLCLLQIIRGKAKGASNYGSILNLNLLKKILYFYLLLPLETSADSACFSILVSIKFEKFNDYLNSMDSMSGSIRDSDPNSPTSPVSPCSPAEMSTSPQSSSTSISVLQNAVQTAFQNWLPTGLRKSKS